jgi:hypothetical protein
MSDHPLPETAAECAEKAEWFFRKAEESDTKAKAARERGDFSKSVVYQEEADRYRETEGKLRAHGVKLAVHR